MGKKGEFEGADPVPGGPLGVPGTEAGTERGIPSKEGERGEGPLSRAREKDLRRLERILEKVSVELKEALEAASREANPPPSPIPSVVLHKIEAPEWLEGSEEGHEGPPPPDPCPLPEREFTLDEEEGTYPEDEAEEGDPPSFSSPPPPFESHTPAPRREAFPWAWTALPAAGIFLLLLGLGILLFAWNGIQGVEELRSKLRAQIEGAKLTGGLLERAEAAARRAEELQSGLERRFQELSARGRELRKELEKATAWMGDFEKRAGNLENAGAELKKALVTASRALEKAKSQGRLSEKAVAQAETALAHLEELSRSLLALADITGEKEILAARLAGDRLRKRLASLGRKTWEPFVSPLEGRKEPETASFPGFERGKPLPKAIRNVLDGQIMVLVPPGRMILGDEEGTGAPDERPGGEKKSLLTVEITRPFYVGRLEVTNACYLKFVKSTGHTPPPYWKGGECPKELLDRPVVCVSWKDARAYCEWAGLRLLTEAEWEYCAKSPWNGRSAGPWPWGKGRPTTSLANFDPTPPLRLKEKDWRFWLLPADSCREGRTPWGLLQMAGNAAEWCSDWYRATWYTTLAGRGGIVRDPQGPPFGLGKVFRGGSWCSTEEELRSSAREMAGPDEKFTFLGFRCARDAGTLR